MNFARVILRNLWFYRVANMAVAAGVAIAAASLIGALIIGDSLRATLRTQALQRTAGASYAITAEEHLFRAELSSIHEQAAPVLLLPAAAQHASGKATANHVQVIGIDDRYFGLSGSQPPSWEENSVLLSRGLARQLGAEPGDEIVLRIERPAALAGESALNPNRDSSLGWRVRVTGVLTPEQGSDLNLRGSGIEAQNVFVPMGVLGRELDLSGKANVLLLPGNEQREVSVGDLETALRRRWSLEDAGLQITPLPHGWLEVRSPRIFMSDAVLRAASRADSNAVPILTYLVNLATHGPRATPYSMVTAAGPPYTPPGMREDEIVLSPWLAQDLQTHAGDEVQLSFFLPDSGAKLEQATNSFRAAGIAPEDLLHLDKTLMPAFPGIEEAERTHDWDAGFPLEYPIREKDEEYWKGHRGTPKAFITLKAGQRLWTNRFGTLTSIRFQESTVSREKIEQALLTELRPEQVGFSILRVRAEALRSAEKSQDFGQLFLAFSGFIVIAALLLIMLLFQFGLESRSAETGILLATGFTQGRLRSMYLREAAVIASIGALAGVGLGVLFAKALLQALMSIWSAAVGGISLQLDLRPATLLAGGLVSLLLSLLTVWGLVRARCKRPAVELISGEVEPERLKRPRRTSLVIAVVCAIGSLVITGWSLNQQETNPAAFFAGGALLLIAGQALCWHWLRRHRTDPAHFSAFRMVAGAPARRPRRSLAVITLLSAGCFVLVSVSAFRLGLPSGQNESTSGTGGFELIASASLPILQDLSTKDGREALGLEDPPSNISIVPFRVREGDEASCLNLNRAAQPRLVAVNPDHLKGRFDFAQVAPGLDPKQGWQLLRQIAPSHGVPEVPAIGDANSVRWSMGKRLGDTIDFRDESGNIFRVRIVATVANSIWQGNLVIDEKAFLQAFPRASGYRFFLIDTAPEQAASVSEWMSRLLEDFGFETVSASQRLAAFNAVQNTYLSAFQILGGIGLLLGSAGLGILVLRNVLERRAELAVLLAGGFTLRRLARLVLGEHALLLMAGVIIGTVAALVAVGPALAQKELGWQALLAALSIILLHGWLWTWAATRFALKGPLLDALRNE